MKIAIIGEFDKNFRPHVATNEAIEHSRILVEQEFQAEWVSTESVETNFDKVLEKYHGFWIAPGSPYKSMKGVLKLIQYTRMNKVPTLGTCGGFQHMAIEFARNVLNVEDAEHAEYNPYASKLVVNPLSCDLKGKALEIEIIDKKSKTYSIYNAEKIKEKYYCNFGLNPEYQTRFDENDFKIVGSDKHKEARIIELENHPFFIATLFVPQDNSTKENPHKLVTEFLKTVVKNQQKKRLRTTKNIGHLVDSIKNEDVSNI
ncbi:CTP synthase [hydrothermal vent metagenome]|uniref:CTP synthase (glutamine hydrolyzing) n=1 Tax=hydrothermal vent metagenome TaxID=652676 RepID=A0A3B0TLV4_9ZZZZ